MTDAEFLQQTKQRLEQFRDEQQRLHGRVSESTSRMVGLRKHLPLLAGALALGLGLSVGYQIGAR